MTHVPVADARRWLTPIYLRLAASPILAGATIGLLSVGLLYAHLTPLSVAIVILGIALTRGDRSILAILVVLASFVDFVELNRDRLWLGTVPLNVIDVGVLAAAARLLVEAKRSTDTPRGLGKSRTLTAAVVVVLLAVGYGTFRAIVEGQSAYDVFRHARAFILVALAVILVRRSVRDSSTSVQLLMIAVAGGVYGIVVPMVQRIEFLLTFAGTSNYLAARNPVSSTAMADLALAIAFAALLGQRLPRPMRLVSAAAAALAVAALLLTLKLSAFVTIVLMPAVAIAASTLLPKRKLAILSGFAAVILFMIAALALAPAEPAEKARGPELIVQAARSLLDLTASPSFQSRELAWGAMADHMDRLGWFIGMGLGFEQFVEGGPRLGIILIAEPTFASIWLTLGVIAVVLAIWLLVVIALNAIQVSRSSADPLLRVFMLGIGVFALTALVSGVLHNNLLAPQSMLMLGVLLGVAEREHDIAVTVRTR